MPQTDTAPYTVLLHEGDFDLRRYETLVLAETEIQGPRSKAANEAFGILAGYIFGKNDANTKIAMTTPVLEEALDPNDETGLWRMRFVMPAPYQLDTLPTTLDSRIRFSTLPERIMASIRFSGTAKDEVLMKQTQRLQDYTQEKTWIVKGEPVYAFYNSPMTLPFLRRNEVLLEIDTASMHLGA